MHRWLVKTICVGPLQVLAGLSEAPVSSQLLLRSSPPHHRGFITVCISTDPSELWNCLGRPPNPLFACNIRFICLRVPPSQPLFRFLFFHDFPPRELLLNKQTIPLPPEHSAWLRRFAALVGWNIEQTLWPLSTIGGPRKPEG